MPCTGRSTSGASLAGFAPVKADVRWHVAQMEMSVVWRDGRPVWRSHAIGTAEVVPVHPSHLGLSSLQSTREALETRRGMVAIGISAAAGHSRGGSHHPKLVHLWRNICRLNRSSNSWSRFV